MSHSAALLFRLKKAVTNCVNDFKHCVNAFVCFTCVSADGHCLPHHLLKTRSQISCKKTDQANRNGERGPAGA